MRKYLTILALILITSITALAGRSSLTPFDRDEARYLQASKQMLETHDLVSVNFQDTPRLHQPAGIYWLESGSAWVASKVMGKEVTTKAWPYRIPSFIAANASVVLTFFIGSIFLSTQAAFLGAALLSVTVLFTAESHLATIDTTMLAVILGMMLCIAKVYCRRDRDRSSTWKASLPFWVLAGVALMLKGPVAWLVPMLTVVSLCIWDRSGSLLKKMGFIWGWVIAALIAAPWVTAISLKTHGEFLNYALGHNFAGKILGSQESHGFWPGYYLAIFALSFWPGIFFLIVALPFAKENFTPKALRLLVCWIVPAWLVFEAIPTKLPHYVMPLFPALCILAASVTSETMNPLSVALPRTWMRYLYRAAFIIFSNVWIISSFVLCIGGLFILYLDDLSFSPAWIILEVFAFFAVLAGAILVLAKDPNSGVSLTVLSSIVIEVICFGFVIPKIPEVNFSREITSAFFALRPTPQTKLASISYKEPSLVFMAGAGNKESDNIALVSPEKALELTNSSCALILADQEKQAVLQNLAQKQQVFLTPLKSLSGLDYSNGHEYALTFLTRAGCPPTEAPDPNFVSNPTPVLETNPAPVLDSNSEPAPEPQEQPKEPAEQPAAEPINETPLSAL